MLGSGCCLKLWCHCIVVAVSSLNWLNVKKISLVVVFLDNVKNMEINLILHHLYWIKMVIIGKFKKIAEKCWSTSIDKLEEQKMYYCEIQGKKLKASLTVSVFQRSEKKIEMFKTKIKIFCISMIGLNFGREGVLILGRKSPNYDAIKMLYEGRTTLAANWIRLTS